MTRSIVEMRKIGLLCSMMVLFSVYPSCACIRRSEVGICSNCCATAECAAVPVDSLAGSTCDFCQTNRCKQIAHLLRGTQQCRCMRTADGPTARQAHCSRAEARRCLFLSKIPYLRKLLLLKLTAQRTVLSIRGRPALSFHTPGLMPIHAGRPSGRR